MTLLKSRVSAPVPPRMVVIVVVLGTLNHDSVEDQGVSTCTSIDVRGGSHTNDEFVNTRSTKKGGAEIGTRTSGVVSTLSQDRNEPKLLRSR